jgi:hypothetical protein
MKKTALGTTLGLGGCIGLLPFGISFLAAQYALDHGARAWPGYTFEIVFVIFHLTLIGAGAWLYTVLFPD